MFDKEETNDGGGIQTQTKEQQGLIKATISAATDEFKVEEEMKVGDITKVNDETFDGLMHQR